MAQIDSSMFKQSLLQILTETQSGSGGSKCPRQFDNSQEAQDDQVDPTSTINQFLEDDHVNNANHLGLAEAKNS